MPKGIFITFEGLDGSGKTTQLKTLATWLQDRGADVVAIRQPGGTSTGDIIRSLLLGAKNKGISPYCEMGLMFSDRAQSLAEVIQPSLAEGKIVLCDRYTDSTEAYQGGGRELGSEMVLKLHRILCQNVWPDLTILLMPDFEDSLKRARARRSSDDLDESRFEQELDAFYYRVFDKYREIASREQKRVVTISSNGSLGDVFKEIVNAVVPILGRRLK